MSDATKAVFLSYASQDAEAAKRICEALRSAGVEVWFDVEGGLETGDEWDAKIRRQIKECVLFLPVISANTQAREEGYFRIEWELAAQRALGIASGVAFILPIVIDDTREPDALVPDRFRTVQWTRLRGGEMTPDAKAKFAKLWSHRTGVLRHRNGESGSPLPATEASPGSVGRARSWRIPMLALGMALAGVAGYLAFKPAAPLPPTPARPTEAAPSEAHRWVDKALVLIRGLEATREDFILAEEYTQRALQLDPDDGDAWAASSQVNAAFVYRGWDTTPARKEQTRVAAERAMRLAPQSVEARLAQAGAWSTFGINRDEREKLLREIVREQPDNQGALRFLAVTVLARPDGFEECLALNERSAALPGGDPLALFNNARYLWSRGRREEGYAVLQRALAQRPFASALVLKMAMEITWRGDLAAAEATLREIPSAALQEDRANYHAGLLRYFQREAKGALEIWQTFPRDYYVDFAYEGPKGLLLGLAYELDGRSAAAKIEWRTALQVVEKRIASAPNNPVPYLRQALLLACLGEKAAAGEALRTYEQLAGLDYGPGRPMPGGVARVYARLGRLDEIFAHLPDDDRAVLRISPDFDALRADPRFARLLEPAVAGAKPPAVPAPRDWPRNPELKKAMGLLDRYDCIPEDLRLAEEIAQRVLDQSPTDPENVTAMARVQATWLARGWDRSSERYRKTQRIAERAVQLAPDEPEALGALATYLNQRGTDALRARQLLDRAIELAPHEARFHRWRNELMWLDRTITEAEVFAAVERTVAQFPHDALVRYDASRHYRVRGRLEEAMREIDATLALAPLANALVWKARIDFGIRQDLAAMKASLDRVPERVRGIERTVFGYFLYAVMSGDYAVGVNALNDMADTWMIDFDYRGPKVLLLASLLEQQGKPALARIQYEIALRELKQRQASEPDDLFLKLDEAWILHGLGRDEEARAAIRIYNESINRPYRLERLNSWWFHPIACNLVLGERSTALALMREAAGSEGGLDTLRRFLASDPRLVAFRDDAEIKALLAEVGK